MTSKTQIVQQYIAKNDKGDLDGAHAFVTDDFQFIVSSNSTKLSDIGFSDHGLDKSAYRDLHKKISGHHRNFVTKIDNIREEGDKVHVKGSTKTEHDVPAQGATFAKTVNTENPFTSVFTFSGDKIKHIHASAT